MASKIPTHHEKQNICGTRPAYREGRFPKAVKVYTVNDESRYLLIQGVPSVGATQELLKLCESFGMVDEHFALDEYPCEDQYTEVYLFKYKRIQSARFAKRKLDEYSFFGGTLHVCYAPEYESVQETKEKLQERRKIVAQKIRQHSENSQNQISTSSHHDRTVQSRPFQDDQSKEVNTLQHTQFESTFLQERQGTCVSSTVVSQPAAALTSSNKFEFTQKNSDMEKVDDSTINSNSQHHFQTFTLPLPPKTNSIHPHYSKTNRSSQQRFSRVPSAHATLPAGYDGRLEPHVSPSDLAQTAIQSTHQTSEDKSALGKKASGIVVRQYHPPKKVTPKFVPRQAVKRTHEESSSNTVGKSDTDPFDQEIRRNAFSLGKVHGPKDEPHKKKTEVQVNPDAVKSVNKTIHNIRSKISKLISDSVRKK